MRTRVKLTLASMILASIFILCSASYYYYDEWSDHKYGEYIPVFMKKSDLKNSVSYSPGKRDLVMPGKIYYRDSYIFVNEKYKGVHIINNTNPTSPIGEGFIIAPGCIDMAVKGDIIYLDNSVDLVAFDLTTKQVTKRIENIFPEPSSPTNSVYHGARPSDSVIVGWDVNNNKQH